MDGGSESKILWYSEDGDEEDMNDNIDVDLRWYINEQEWPDPINQSRNPEEDMKEARMLFPFAKVDSALQSTPALRPNESMVESRHDGYATRAGLD